MNRLLPIVSSLFQDMSGQSWSAALNDAAPIFDAPLVHVWVRDPVSGTTVLDVLNSGRDPSLIDEYQTHYAAQDVRLPQLTALNGRTQPCWKTVDAAEFDRSDVVRGYLDRKDIDLRWSLGTGFRLDNGFEIICGSARGRSSGAFSMAEARLFDHLALNLRSAIDLRFKVADAKSRKDEKADTLATRQTASVVLDGRGKVLFASPNAERSLAAGALFRVENGRLKMSGALSERRLDQFLGRLRDAPAPFETDTWFHQAEADGAGPVFRITLSVMPGPEADDLTAGNSGRIATLVTVEGPVGGRTASAMLAGRGLSLAERDVALGIIAGQSVREIATEKQRSVETIRSQLKSLMGKLGLNRQAELIRFVADSRG